MNQTTSSSDPTRIVSSRSSNTQQTRSLNSLRRAPNTINNKVICEYCSDLCYPNFYDNHKRICPQNPSNVRTIVDFDNTRTIPLNKTNTPQATSGSSRSKISCKYCPELCYPAFLEQHKRICVRNPANIKSTCEFCKKIMGSDIYEVHIEVCEKRAGRIASVNLDLKDADLEIRAETQGELDESIMMDHDDECPICIEKIRGTFEQATLPCCHKFHKDCLKRWSKKQRKCPMCRTAFKHL